MTNRNGMKVSLMAVLAVLSSACGGAAAPESKVARLGAQGGVIALAQSGVRIEVPAGAVSGEVEFRVSEAEVHGARRGVHVEVRGRLEKGIRVHFSRPDDVAVGATMRVVRVDDHGDHLELGDDDGGQGELEPGDDDGGAGELEPGDDKGQDWVNGAAGVSIDGGTFGLEVGDDDGGQGELEPGDDNGGAVEPGDDNGVDAAAPVDDSGNHG